MKMKKNIYISPKFQIRTYRVEDIITTSPGGGNSELPPVWGGAMFKTESSDGNETNEG